VHCSNECGNIGGAVASVGSAAFTASTLSGNEATCDDQCEAEGGAVFVGQIEAGSASAFSGRSGAAAASRFGVHAAAPAGPALSSTTSQFSGNVAACTVGTNCGGDGGAAYADAPTTVEITSSTFSANVARVLRGCAQHR